MHRVFGALINCAAVLPVIGQVCGIFMIAAAIRDCKASTNTFETMESRSYLLRGILTFLGLGILCLLLDLIVSFAVLIKEAVLENTNEFEHFT